MFDEESDQGVDHPNDIGDDFELGDDIDDEYITKNYIDDHADMRDPFNDSDSEPDDDTYVELYEEESE